MRAIVIALVVIWLAQQPVPDSKRPAESHSAAQSEKSGSRTTEQKPASNKTPSVSTPKSEPSNNQPPSCCVDTAAKQPNDDTEIQRKIKDFTFWLVVVGFLQGLALIGQAVILCYTLKMIGKQTHLMAHHAKSLARVHRAARDNASAAVALAEEAGKQVSELSKLATAAKTSADIAAGVYVPTLVVEKFELGNMGNAHIIAILQLPKLNIVIRNYGQTPALLHSWSVVLTCEELPEIPDYFGHPGSGNLLEKKVIQPNEPYVLPELQYYERQAFSLDDVQAILDHKKLLAVYGYVCYGDIFGNPLKRLKFGEFALNIWDTGIEWSDMGDPRYCGTELYAADKKAIKVTRYGPKAETND